MPTSEDPKKATTPVAQRCGGDAKRKERNQNPDVSMFLNSARRVRLAGREQRD